MITINFIGYITNDLNSVSKDIPHNIYIMKSDFTIYNARTHELILNVPDKFLFFNIVSKKLYKIFSSRKCFRNIINNQKYVYRNYVYNYDSTLDFWMSKDSRKLDYAFINDILPNGYIYSLEPQLYFNHFYYQIPILTQTSTGKPTFTSTLIYDSLSNAYTSASISISNFSYDVNFNVQYDTSRYIVCDFNVSDSTGKLLYSKYYLGPTNSTGTKCINILFSGNFDSITSDGYIAYLGIVSSSDFTIVSNNVNQFAIFTN